MRRFSLLALPQLLILAAAVVLLTGTASAKIRERPKSTPARTLGDLKSAAAKQDYAKEWGTLSPGFKQRLNAQAGRNVDVGDYITFRTSNRKDPQVRELMSALRGARIQGVKYRGQGRARVFIRFGGPLFLGKTIPVEMINHEFWVLFVKGETQPYWGFAGDKKNELVKHKDGSFTVQSRDAKGKVTWSQTFKKEQVETHRVRTRWYFHHFGQFEREFFGNLK